MNRRLLFRYVAAAVVGFYGFYYATSFGVWHFIDSVNLVVHEAGHVVFSLFGTFLLVLGGSLLQILFPFIFVLYFWFKDDRFSAGLLLTWVGINIISVAVYAGDAVRMQLPLITGDTDGHDWNYLLIRTGLLHYTDTVSTLFWVLAIITLLLGAYFSFKNVAQENFDIEETLR